MNEDGELGLITRCIGGKMAPMALNLALLILAFHLDNPVFGKFVDV